MKLNLLVVILALSIFPVRTPAPIYMNIDNIPGEVRDDLHPSSIEIESFSWGMTQSAVTGGAGAGKVTLQDFHFTKSFDKSSPLLMQKCANGLHIPKVQLFLRKIGADKPVEYYQITLEDCIVSSYSTASGGDRPTESLSLNFTKVTISYQAQKDDGSLDTPVIFTWNKVTAAAQ